ncbi:MAG: hypothetical protein AB7G93_05375 [Bdellovibrionales bacterium]
MRKSGVGVGFAVLMLIASAVLVTVGVRKKDSSVADSDNLPTLENPNDPDHTNGVSSVPGAARVRVNRVNSGLSENKRTPAGAFPAAASPDPQFRSWIRQEAQTLNQTHLDGEHKRQEIARVVSNLTRAQARELLNAARSSTSASEKILSTFLLVQGGTKTLPELREFISAPLESATSHQPHSSDEVKGVREKSLRIMAVDGLFSEARTNPRAREALAKVARETQDPFIRSYAEDKLKAL